MIGGSFDANLLSSGIVEVTSVTPETSLNFLQVLFSLLPSSLHYCEDRSHLQFFIRSSNIRYSYIYSRPDSSLHGFITKTMTSFQMECSTN